MTGDSGAPKTVQVTGGFWGQIMEVNRRVTLPIEYARSQETGRIDMFRLDWKPGQPNPPHIYWDSDVGKWIEAAAYSLAAHPDSELEQRIDDIIDMMADAQQSDGYLNTYFIAVEPENRWANLRDNHELYCAGHLIEGAVAYYEATGKRTFLDVMCRYADYIGRIFGPNPGQRRGYCGHEEIELALVKLYRATENETYLDIAQFFVAERGQRPHYFDEEAEARGDDPWSWPRAYDYNQSHVPIVEQSEVVGHAVRAMYLYCGMTDLAIERDDAALWAACRRLWKDLVERKMHITGGLGPTRENESFTCGYDLPNEGAYLETCAAIGLVFWAWRMLNADRDARYADVMERALYNGTISGVSADGETFFYGNPLAVHPGFDGNGRFVGEAFHYRRSEWFGCACCPPNLARMIAQFPDFMYSVGRKELAVHLYAESEGRFTIADQSIRLVQRTAYPWEETVSLTVYPETPASWTLALRIPEWCRDASLCVNGEKTPATTRKGYVRLKREWREGDRIEMTLPMPVERIEAHPAVRQNCGKVAVQRGPVVYCLEETDNGANLSDIILPPDAAFTIQRGRNGLLKGIPVLRARGWRRNSAGWNGKLYRHSESKQSPCRITAIPYFLWANREPGEMIVWIQQAASTADS